MKLLPRVALFFLLTSMFVSAQVERVLPRKGLSSLEGTEFVVGFMENEIEETGGNPTLQIFISSQYRAVVTIDLPMEGRRYLTIPANTVHVEDIQTDYTVRTPEVPIRKAIFITSDVPIVVYAYNTLLTSTDSYSVIPIKHLGTQYLTVNRSNDRYNYRNTIEDTMQRGGEFMIMAVKDFTTLTITPTARTEAGRNAYQTYSVTLNRGECYLVKSYPNRFNGNDLTGSRVESDAPVAVISGHVRTAIPTIDFGFKDHLAEMLLPINKWGKAHVTTPFEMSKNGDYVRILAAESGTTVTSRTASGSATQFLPASGDWQEFIVTEPTLWESDKPICVVQFMTSANLTSTGARYYDPAMVIVPPLELYTNSALFQFPELKQQANYPRNYFINIVTDDVALPTLRIDNQLVTSLVPAISYQKVPGVAMHWAQVPLPMGVHAITAESGLFSGVMYGTTYADSYANLFGITFDPIKNEDLSPPVYSMNIHCGDVTGTVKDVAKDSALLTELTVLTPPSTFNYWYSVLDVNDSIGSKTIEAGVRDLWSDGQIVIQAYDDKGNGREWLYFYDAPNISRPIVVTVSSSSSATVCVDIPIVNADSTPTTIAGLRLSGDPRFSISGQPIVNALLAGRDTLWVKVCFTPSKDTSNASAVLTVQLPCNLNLPIEIRSQVKAGLLASSYDFGSVLVGDTVCSKIFVVNTGSVPVSIDSLKRGLGTGEFTVRGSIPAMPAMTAPGDTVWFDVCYSPDSVGNRSRTDSVVSKEVQFVITNFKGKGIRPRIHNIVVDFGKRRVGTTADTVVKLYNYGDAPCTASYLQRTINDTSFVFDQPGLPASIQPGNSTLVRIKFIPRERGVHNDTVPMTVDWRFHEPVHIAVIGEAILPDVSTTDIDFGNVFLGEFKDTVETLVTTGGNDQLRVYSVAVNGPDANAFTVPKNVMAMTVVDAGILIKDSIRFTPQRLGQHRSEVVIAHNADPNSQQATSTIVFTGVGLEVPYTSLEAELVAPSVLAACKETNVVVEPKNLGTLPIVIDSVTLLVGTDRFEFSNTFPDTLTPGQQTQYQSVIVASRNSDRSIVATVYYSDSLQLVLQQSFDVTFEPPVITSAARLDGAPGSYVSIDVNIASEAIRTEEEQIAVEIIASRSKWAVTADTVNATITDGNGGPRDVSLYIVPSVDGARLDLAEQVLAPYQIRFTVAGMVLWKDPIPTDVFFNVLENSCADGANSTSVLTMDLCAGAKRMIKFLDGANVRASIVQQPAGETLKIQFETAKSTYVMLSLIDLSGQRFGLVDNYPLQKGLSDCNFSLSEWTSGFYSLIVKHEDGEEVLPVVIVK